MGNTPANDPKESITDKAIRRAIGEELRSAREARRWTRDHFVTCLPSGVGARTLLSYETGSRTLTVMRMIEICRALNVSPAAVLTRSFRRARVFLENLEVPVDLLALLHDRTPRFRPLHVWARRKLDRQGQHLVDLSPEVVDELADFLGCSSAELTVYLSKFVPDELPPAHDLPTGKTTQLTRAESATRHQEQAVPPEEPVAAATVAHPLGTNFPGVAGNSACHARGSCKECPTSSASEPCSYWPLAWG